MPFKLKEQLIAYGAYHNNPTNVAIHMTCVPFIMATAFFFASNTPTLRTPPSLIPLLTRLHLPLNLNTIVGTLYATLYLYLSPNLAGLSLSPLVLALSSTCNLLLSKCASGTSRARLNGAAAAIHVASWIAQFVGHGKYEGRKPALLDNLAQALFLAPLFVWYEALFGLGFYKGLKREVDAGVGRELARIKAEKEKGAEGE
ncbi:DUF962-domain-containing protein [Lophiostoma macrostomum CBS 122681]|uniref:DUF962-domain-containing protein n=1 Tax=Lophiostoma macrostomum CBS 122681 TaxID=1314788 RepID=A0A6A6TDP5_9PLEO|nr:DUF962-domain-containing protein [Lophiostoma macrostomum CBS 122681]